MITFTHHDVSGRVSPKRFLRARFERCIVASHHVGYQMRTVLLFILLIALHAPVANSAAIHDAIKKGDLAALNAALSAGADVNQESSNGLTPLYLAVIKGQVESAKLLIAHGANINGMTMIGTPLMAAADRDGPELVTLLLASGADANTGRESQTALHIAAKRGCLGCVKALVEAGANVNAQHIMVNPPFINVTTPLHLAILNDHADIAEYLIAHGVTFPKPAPITARLASADLGKGQEIFKRECTACHTSTTDPDLRGGPYLWNVVGRDKASLAGYRRYSKTLLALPGVWTYEDLNVFLSGPTLTTPGVGMNAQGVTDEDERADLIAYLRTLSDNPVPLP